MFREVFFFMYIFAGFAGVLAIMLAALLIKYRSSGNKALLASIRNFMICMALIDFLYFYLDYMKLRDGQYSGNAVIRVMDICLFIGQVYFWNAYIREKSMMKATESRRVRRISLILVMICIVLSVIDYGFLMEDYYVAAPGINSAAPVVMELIISALLTIINVWHLKIALFEVVQKKCRRYIAWESVLLLANGIWNCILVICILMGKLDYIMETIVDPSSIVIFVINVITILLILSEDFTALFKAMEGKDGHEDKLTMRLDYIARTHFLTEREREVMELAYNRMTNPEIADELCISKYTVKNHMHNIFEKLDISTRADLILFIDKES